MVVVAPAFGVALWHGGYTRGGLLAFAAVAAAGLALVRPAPPAAATVLLGGLTAVAAANLASLAWHRDSSAAAALAAAALPLLVWIGSARRPQLARWLPLLVLALGLVTATAGLAGLVLRSPPLAERIAGVWRAGGTFEYPPALGLVCVCALAAALALHAAGELDGTGTVVAAALLTAAAAASFDRVAWLGDRGGAGPVRGPRAGRAPHGRPHRRGGRLRRGAGVGDRTPARGSTRASPPPRPDLIAHRHLARGVGSRPRAAVDRPRPRTLCDRRGRGGSGTCP